MDTAWCAARASAIVSAILLLHDGVTRFAFTDRHRRCTNPNHARLAWPILTCPLHAGRSRRSLLALCGYHLDFPAASVVPDRHSRQTFLSGGTMPRELLTQRTYYVVFAMLIALTILTVGLSFVHLGTVHAIAGLT